MCWEPVKSMVKTISKALVKGVLFLRCYLSAESGSSSSHAPLPSSHSLCEPH